MKMHPYKVLFVCTGNSCRSPMAEGILKDLLEKEGVEDVVVESAGTMAPSGMSPTNFAVLTMVEMGIDISSHKAQPLTEAMVKEADLILVMERVHQHFIEHFLPSARDKVFLLKTFGKEDVEGNMEIDDPIGGDLDFYRMCGQILKREIERILPLILRMAGHRDQ